MQIRCRTAELKFPISSVGNELAVLPLDIQQFHSAKLEIFSIKTQFIQKIQKTHAKLVIEELDRGVRWLR